MLNDIVNSVKATLYDRTSSPLFGAFAVSWAVWNYRILVVLTGAGEFQAKLKHIDELIYPTWWHVGGIGIVGPTLTALAFIYFYPRPARAVYEFTLGQSRKLRELRQKIEGEELLTVEESRELRQRHVTMQIEFDRQIKTLQADREAARTVAASSTQTVTEQAAQITALNAELAGLRKTLATTEREHGQRVANLELLLAAHGGAGGPGGIGGGGGAGGGVGTTVGLTSSSMTTLPDAKQRASMIAQKRENPTTEEMTDTVWRLTFNPERRNAILNGRDGSKLIHLLPLGAIGDGRNNNEDTWRLTGDGRLEFVQADRRTHSRFAFDKATGRWESEADSTLGMKTPRQYMAAEP